MQRSYNEPVPAARPLTKRAQQRQRTEARILAAARQVFASSGYERATIRAVARAAQVNPGLVIHYFGSKQELFRQAVGVANPLEIETEADLVEAIVASLALKLGTLPLEATATLRSMFTHPEAGADVRQAVIQQAEQIGGAIDADAAALRATLIESIMLGVVIGRHLLDLDVLRDAAPEQIADLLRPCFETLTQTSPSALSSTPEGGRVNRSREASNHRR